MSGARSPQTCQPDRTLYECKFWGPLLLMVEGHLCGFVGSALERPDLDRARPETGSMHLLWSSSSAPIYVND